MKYFSRKAIISTITGILIAFLAVSSFAAGPPRFSVSTTTLSNDANGCFADQTTAGAADLTLDGALVSGGVCVHAAAQQIAIEGAADESGVIATITGTSANGQKRVETLTLANASTATSVQYFKTIESISVDGALTGNIEGGPLSTNGAVSPSFAPDLGGKYEYQFPIEVIITGTLTYQVEYTLDETPQTDDSCGTCVEPDWNAHEVLTGKTATDVSNISLPVGGVRTKITAYTSGTTVTTALQSRSN